MAFQNILGKSIDELTVGECAYFAKTITETDIYQFASVTCDFNPAHVNAAYAGNTFFKQRIAHGMLTVSLVSNVSVSYTHLDVYKRQKQSEACCAQWQ